MSLMRRILICRVITNDTWQQERENGDIRIRRDVQEYGRGGWMREGTQCLGNCWTVVTKFSLNFPFSFMYIYYISVLQTRLVLRISLSILQYISVPITILFVCWDTSIFLVFWLFLLLIINFNPSLVQPWHHLSHNRAPPRSLPQYQSVLMIID